MKIPKDSKKILKLVLAGGLGGLFAGLFAMMVYGLIYLVVASVGCIVVHLLTGWPWYACIGVWLVFAFLSIFE